MSFPLTYDDVGLAGASAGVGCEVALDLVSGLIEQVQIVFHRVSIMKALAQTDDTWWWRKKKKTGMVDTRYSLGELCFVESRDRRVCFSS